MRFSICGLQLSGCAGKYRCAPHDDPARGRPLGLAPDLAVLGYCAPDADVLFTSSAQKLLSGLENYGLLAILLFQLTGEMMNEGGMARRLINAARVFVGGFRGGLAYINLLANMFMAAMIPE
ncbi:Tripartite ATP-independent transporter, DctM component [Paracoccus isoporae]|uniref:Tripartite ATP-independent transporter, DctM component n=1 Tax=Paracoccus isoporae TaxID=591205 RepID=A0A1G7F499_9RHOB|nr:TRAP transporter large permease subunit [Paracoccus isoporae]SDE70717.1 Tripartite ATP-independent transporter, DctM component [Paracoccus isoporae]